jgi:hypothetical protein
LALILGEVKMKVRQPITSRIAAIADYWGKTRLVAIGDYYSQRVLKPFGNDMLTILKSLGGDATHSQGFKSNQLSVRAKEGKKLWCFDLSKATDRFPREITGLILRKIYGESVGSKVLAVLSQRKFQVRTSRCKAGVQQVMYGTGQPMGLNGSW